MQRFIDNGDGTVTDTKTGLAWQKNTLAKDVTHQDAEKRVAELGEGWRLPTIEELFSLIDHGRVGPAIDTDVFPDTENDWYWTSTPCAWNAELARWVVGFGNGIVFDDHRGLDACVRAVRAGQ